MRTKVLLVIPTLDPCGAEKQLALLAMNLPRDRFEVHVAVLTRDGPWSQPLRQAMIPITLIGKKGKISIRALWRLRRLIREFRPDVVHTWLFAANCYGRVAAFAEKVPRVICGERCVDPWKTPLHFAIDRYLAKKTDIIAVNSEGIRDFYVAHRLPNEKFVVIPNAAVPVEPSDITKEELFESLGIEYEGNRRPFLIGMVARLWPQKRIKEALWSCDQLSFAGLDYRMVIIGNGPQRDELLRYRSRLLLDDRVIFVGERKDVPRFLSHFDLLWSTGEYEGQSNSILEAMSVGVPVIASNIPGNRELVLHGQTGLLIPEFDGDNRRRRSAVTDAALNLLLPVNESLRKQMGENAKQRIAAEFTLEKMVQRYATLYQSGKIDADDSLKIE